jgi:hypothetical protein
MRLCKPWVPGTNALIILVNVTLPGLAAQRFSRVCERGSIKSFSGFTQPV